MHVPLLLYHYDLSILMWSLFLRVRFLEVLFYMVMWRGAPHTYQVYVWSLSLCRCVGARACGASPGQIVYMYTIGLSMPGKREALGRCWFNVGPRRINGRLALIRHWFSVSCLLGSLHNFTLFLTIYYSMLCFLDSVS